MADKDKIGKPGQNDRGKKTGVLGLEPRLSDPESLVLPLHHTPVTLYFTIAYAHVRHHFRGASSPCNRIIIYSQNPLNTFIDFIKIT